MKNKNKTANEGKLKGCFSFYKIVLAQKERYKSDKAPRENIIYIRDKAKEFVENFDNDETKSLLFVGSTGLGK